MSFDKLNNDWQQEFQEIPVPVAKMDELLAAAMTETAPAPTKSTTKVRRWTQRKYVKPLLTAAALLLVAVSAGKIYLDNRNGFVADQPLGGVLSEEKAADQETAQETAPESPATDTTSQEKISYIYHLNQETTDFDQSLAAVNALITKHKGYIDGSNVTRDGETSQQQAAFTLRIPETEKTAFLNELRKLAPVVSEQQESTNLTKSYQDNDSRLKALAAEETALLTMLEKADKMEDMLKIQARLTDIRSEKESLTSQQKQIDEDVTYSTIYLDLQEISQTKADSASPQAGTRIKNNWHKQVAFWQQLITSIGVFIASNFIYLIVAAVLGFIAWRKWQKAKDV